MYQRYLQTIIEELLPEFRVLYLTGPRQAGKTTIVRDIAAKQGIQYLTLDDQATFNAARQDPHGLIRSLGDKRIAIDEFQYAPELILAIKEVSDQLGVAAQGKFLLTGSADIFRSAKTQESLPGHMARLELYPLSVSEHYTQPLNLVDWLTYGALSSTDVSPPFLTREFIAALIIRGGYPEPQTKSDRAKSIWYQSYVEGRLFKDFDTLYDAKGGYHEKLQALIPYLAGISGNLLKYASVSNDLEFNERSIKRYIEVLDLMFIVHRAVPYLKNPAKRQATATRMPKLHFVDTGLACHLLSIKTPERLLASQYYGPLLESLIYMELLKQASWASNPVSLYHYRDNRKNQLDIVLEEDDQCITGIEIKGSASVSMQDFKGLLKLAEFTGKNFRQGIVIYTGDKILPFEANGLTLYAIPIGLLV